MMTTILAAVALSGSVAAKPSVQPQTDYGQALRQAAAEGKPMAVLIGTGNSFAKLMGDAAISDDTAKLLRDKFVCVTVDVGTTSGAQLASQFQLTDGLVISSVGGTHQALRQSGAISATDLAKHAAAYATAGAPATTVTAGAPAVTYTSGYTPSAPVYSYPSYRGTVIQGGCAGGSCGTVVPSGYSFPSYGYSTGGGCANGRCPTPR